MGAYLINLIITKVLSVWNVFSADLVVHVGLDTARGDAVDGNLLVTHVYVTLAYLLQDAKMNIPIAMHLTKVSMAPLLPE
jgi:hypothetical protein